MKYKRDFFVCFRRANKDYWWQIFTGKKRSHIFLITPCEKNSCVMIDPSEGGTAIYAYPHSAERVLQGKQFYPLINHCYALNRPFLLLSSKSFKRRVSSLLTRKVPSSKLSIISFKKSKRSKEYSIVARISLACSS